MLHETAASQQPKENTPLLSATASSAARAIVLEDPTVLPTSQDELERLSELHRNVFLTTTMVTQIIQYLTIPEALAFAATNKKIERVVLRCNYTWPSQLIDTLDEKEKAQIHPSTINDIVQAYPQIPQQEIYQIRVDQQIIYGDQNQIIEDGKNITQFYRSSNHLLAFAKNETNRINAIRNYLYDPHGSVVHAECCLGICTGATSGGSLLMNVCCSWGENSMQCRTHASLCDNCWNNDFVGCTSMNGIECASNLGCFNHVGLFGLACAGLSILTCALGACAMAASAYESKLDRQVNELDRRITAELPTRMLAQERLLSSPQLGLLLFRKINENKAAAEKAQEAALSQQTSANLNPPQLN